jgi:heptosyltransferase-3
MRILVIQLRRLGDILMTTPLLRHLRRTFPDARLDFLCEGMGLQLLEHNPCVSECLVLPTHATAVDLLDMGRELRRRRYDWVVDCQGLPKTVLLARLSGAPVRVGFGGRWWRALGYTHRYARHNADYSALDKLRMLSTALDAGAAPAGRDLGLDFPVSGESRQAAEHFCHTWFRGKANLPPTRPGGPFRWPVVALFGVSRQAYKVWPPEKLAEIGRRLASRGLQPLLVYGPGESEAARRVALELGPDALFDYPMPSLAVLSQILARCALFVGNDGGPKHLAALAGLPTVAVFGHVHPENWTCPDDSTQRWVATASRTRAVPTRGVCTEAQALEDIPVDAVWEVVEALATAQGVWVTSFMGSHR